MKKLLIPIISILAIGQLIAQDLSPDQIVSNYLKAISQDKLMKMETFKITGKMNQQGLDFLFTVYEKKPKKSRQEIEVQGMTIIVVFDGETGWMINPMMGISDPQDMPAESIKSLEKEDRSDPTGSWENPLTKWKEYGIKIELSGKEDINGSPAYNLKLTFPDDYKVNYFIDATRFVLVKTQSTETVQGQTFEREIKFSDYKDFDGILLPAKIDIVINGQQGQVITIDKCEFNIPIDDSIYKKPVKNQD